MTGVKMARRNLHPFALVQTTRNGFRFLPGAPASSFFLALGRWWHVVVAMGGPGREPLSVLFTHYGEPWIRGSEQVLIDLTSNLNRRRFNPVIWCNGGPLADLLEK